MSKFNGEFEIVSDVPKCRRGGKKGEGPWQVLLGKLLLDPGKSARISQRSYPDPIYKAAKRMGLKVRVLHADGATFISIVGRTDGGAA